ncbi:hypothetical protein LAZ67_15000994 [Cordylochernes scorpioides]|uniref:RNA-directed DNA polymerase n=1 Tax=Cordylochernes scorpioides TaxID=51811 RepID=A0ABY6L8E4_9ARAC|nr:hypothetical protein LAZ67_15000994 [Cordylochernes scorpioides]
MAQIQPPETFDFSTPNEWPKWRKRFERYLVVSGMKKKEEADKIDLFMYLMGDRADDIFRSFKFEKEKEAKKIDSVLKAFDSHFCVRKNIICECAKFNSRIQEDREPVDEFITSLYKLADSCEFEGLHEQLIRDRIVVGVGDKALSERMQLDSELTLEKAVKMVRQQQVDLQRPSTSQKVNQVKLNSKKQSPKQQQQSSRKKEKSAKTRSRCPKCGGFTHREGQACRAEEQRCNLCSKTGHFANCCPDKQAKTVEVEAVSEFDEEIGFLLEVSAVEDSSNLDDDEGECRRRWTEEIQVNGKQKIMGQQRLVESDINIRAAEFSELQTVGMFISTLRNGNYEIKEKIYVIRRLSEPLLSRRACELLNLARRIEMVATRINPILAAYDLRKPTMVSSDASSYGLGAVLKTMTPTEKRYAQIEKEALAITWACERFQDFLLGKRFRIETDHKPLIPLFSTKELMHIPGNELLDADALSRQPLLTTEGGENERPTSAHINAVLSCITDKDEMLTKIFEAQQEDTTLKAVVNYLEQGWPDKKKMSQTLLSYWNVMDEFGVQNGLLMRSCRLVIQASMKLKILDKLHAGHFRITKTRLRARETVWWPEISEEIAETVRKFSVCIQEAVSKHEPLIPTNFPTRPWQNIGLDLFKFENKWYLVVIDYYSRFPEMIQLDRLTAVVANPYLPDMEYQKLLQYGFTHVTSSPRFPQSNGMAEAGVKIAKLILKKNQDPSLGLLEYRSTPLENGYSPAELLMGHPEKKGGEKDMKSRYDRRCGATDMEELSEGDTVWITDMRIWGIVKQKASTPRSYMVDTPVGTVRRNRFHLRKGDTVQYPADPSTPTFSGGKLVENEKTPVVDYPSKDSEDGQVRTRTAPNMEYKRCSSCIPRSGALTGYYQLGPAEPSVVMKSNREFENRAAIIVALRAGRSPKEIVDFLKLPKTTIYRVKKQKKHSRRSDRVRGEEFVKNVKEKIDGNPGKSMRAIAKEMDVGSMTIVRTIHEDLGLKSYALRKGQLLTENMKNNRKGKAAALLNNLKHDSFGMLRFFSDEKNFDVDQKVNPRNDRWICKDPSEIPVVMHTKFPASVMVLGVISSEGDVMPPHFFEKGLRMNADTYINVLETVVKPWMDMVAAGRKYVFQQDSAPAHKAKKTQSWLTLNVPSHWGPDIWPLNSPDCNPLDYYVWGVVERDVNKAPHTTIQSVKKAVHTVMTQMDKVIVAKACASFRTRLETVVANNGNFIE